MQRCDVRVIQLGQELGLSLESLQPIPVSRKLLGKNFDRDLASELGVAGSVDLAHSPGADLLKDLVVSEGLTDHRELVLIFLVAILVGIGGRFNPV